MRVTLYQYGVGRYEVDLDDELIVSVLHGAKHDDGSEGAAVAGIVGRRAERFDDATGPDELVRRIVDAIAERMAYERLVRS